MAYIKVDSKKLERICLKFIKRREQKIQEYKNSIYEQHKVKSFLGFKFGEYKSYEEIASSSFSLSMAACDLPRKPKYAMVLMGMGRTSDYVNLDDKDYSYLNQEIGKEDLEALKCEK